MTREEIKTIFKRNIIERLELLLEEDEIGDNDSLFGFDSNGKGIGLDSIDILELIVILKKEFGIEVQIDENREIFENVNTLSEFIYKKMENSK